MASNQLNEQEIQFKKRARRRLVGAIALVLLMVTILPMVLDDRAAKVPQQEIAITIPSQDNKDFTSKVVPVQEPPAVAPETALPEEKPAEPPATAQDSRTPVPAKVDPVAPSPASDDLPAAQKPVTPNKPANDMKPAEPTSAQTSSQMKSAGTTTVQIGVFSDSNNVKQLQQKLQTLGYKSYTEKVATTKGDKIRLRAGPFADRPEAEAALARIKDAGMTGMVVSR